jgi:hypothetical protein
VREPGVRFSQHVQTARSWAAYSPIAAGSEKEGELRKLIATGSAFVVLALMRAAGALATSTGNPGQPNQSCQAQPSQPGGQVPGSNPGSPFAGGVSDGKYAGSQPQNSNNPKSVSQYDVACFQVSQH